MPEPSQLLWCSALGDDVFPDAPSVSAPGESPPLPFFKHPTICFSRRASDDEPQLNYPKAAGTWVFSSSLCQ